jgi:hypothetical protein
VADITSGTDTLNGTEFAVGASFPIENSSANLNFNIMTSNHYIGFHVAGFYKISFGMTASTNTALVTFFNIGIKKASGDSNFNPTSVFDTIPGSVAYSQTPDTYLSYTVSYAGGSVIVAMDQYDIICLTNVGVGTIHFIDNIYVNDAATYYFLNIEWIGSLP